MLAPKSNHIIYCPEARLWAWFVQTDYNHLTIQNMHSKVKYEVFFCWVKHFHQLLVVFGRNKISWLIVGRVVHATEECKSKNDWYWCLWNFHRIKACNPSVMRSIIFTLYLYTSFKCKCFQATMRKFWWTFRWNISICPLQNNTHQLNGTEWKMATTLPSSIRLI